MRRVFFSILFLIFATSVYAQEVTVTTRGVSGDVDKKERDPHLTVTRLIEEGKVTLLADAIVRNPELQKYPIRFEFFINRHLFASQIRSDEVPGPIGIVVGQDIATPPFNYSIIASVIHPNRRFTTVLHGAAFASELNRRLDCTATLVTDPEEETELVYLASDVNTQQIDNATFALTFEAREVETEEKATFTTTVVVVNGEATSTTTVTRDGTTTTIEAPASVTLESNALSAFEIVTEDGDFTLGCS